MKWLIAVLAPILLLLQYQLWIGDGSLPAAWRLESAIEQQQAENARLRQRNQALAAEVQDLTRGLEAMEERARSELGMIRRGETFFHVIERP